MILECSFFIIILISVWSREKETEVIMPGNVMRSKIPEKPKNRVPIDLSMMNRSNELRIIYPCALLFDLLSVAAKGS